MKKIIALGLVTLFFVNISSGQDKKPQSEIKNELIHVRFYLPDNESGYYRSTRFDWSGVIGSLEYAGHSYFDEWNDTYDPLLHDAITGLVEEFTPLGYNEAPAGGNFVKIGVGVLFKPEEPKYGKFNYYQIVDHGKWKVKKKSDQITFTHSLKDKDYGYEYEKTESLIRGKPVLEISHRLKNKGLHKIETSVYCHNFFVMDSTIVGPAYVVEFPFNIMTGEQKAGNVAYVQGNKISFNRQLIKGEITSISGMTGFSNDSKDYVIKIENHKTGAGVKITGDHPISRMIFWAMPKTLCPEPFINIKIEPGEEFTWKLIYEFYSIDSQK